MGTSASSNGPNSRVPFDPPWLDDIEFPGSIGDAQPDGQEDNDPRNPDGNTELLPQPQFAPLRRFQSARTYLRDFARTGDHESFRKAIGNYSQTGMGGARNVANRMRLSTKSAESLFNVLQTIREGTDPAINEWVTSLTSRNASAGEIIDEIISRFAPNGGSIDEKSCQNSMAQALQSLIDKDPNVNLLDLEDKDIWVLIESFLGYEAFSRLCLDIGQVFESSTLDHRDRVLRMNEMHDYLEAEVCVQIEELRNSNQNATSNQLHTVLQTALKNTFLVYEGAL